MATEEIGAKLEDLKVEENGNDSAIAVATATSSAPAEVRSPNTTE
jgi:hypothetical protein